jgi:fibro-slime domain-containing protein
MSDSTIGINLNGRRFGSNYTTIIAWDDDDYSYSGLKTENGHITVCPLSEAEDFYFAVVHPVDPGDETTEAKTVDNDQYGISMKMIDYNNPIVGGRDSGQTAFFGGDNGVINTGTGKGLLSTDLKDDGYPVSTAKTGNEGTSLSGLYQDTATTPMKTANHLFLSSIYNESGYFEYDSTQNFSHLNDDGTFTVYDQLGAITGDSEHKNTREHGQFMPYNDIAGGRYAYDRDGELIRNQTDVYGNELPDTDARKGEVMYDVGNNKIAGQVDYFFGMEMSASFTQTASGLDAWGHDIIFEFSGDDDFWLYVDNELVLDLGGVHSAQVGTINFRTGKITSSNGNSTLYETFRSNYQTRGMSEAEISAKLDELFEEKTVDGERVYTFKDYTNHTMKVFYMERGAGSSNLHMRFNLAAVKPGTVELSKKLSGTDNPENNLIEFPYQIFYKSSQDAEYHLLTEKTGDDYNVLYKDSVRSVTYKDRFTPAGGTESYQNVFFLKSGEAAVINLPEDTVDYYIKECGIDPNVYDKVSANGTQLTGTPTGNGSRKDYAVEAATMLERQKVDFDNHVRPGAMRTLSITKKLYDSDGITLLHYPDDDTMFTFRLYLGNESADPNSLPLANNYSYYIKDAQGNYCRWVPAQKKFVSLGITDYAELAEYLSTLSNAEKEKIIFTTSMNGSISKITADHTVEIRDLIVDTQWKVEERDWELPKGYTRRDADGYKRVDSGHETQQREPISGTIKVNNDPEIQVQNQIGWGLTVKKIWTDKDFMESHDDIYFAVYLNNGNDLELIGGTVRPLTTSDTELYYFLDDLYNGTSTSHRFSDYEIREVMISNNHPIIEDGVVTNPGTVTPISDNGTLTTGGTPVGGSHKDGYEYTVNYKVGSTTGQNENIRTDEVTNSRPGIKLYKKDWAGNDLAGTVFTLKDSNGNDVAAPDYESDSDGLITIAYLSPGTYTLTETEVPGGYTALPSDMNITVNTNGTVSVSGLSENYYTLDTESDPKMAAVITIKDRASELKAIKKDADTEEPIDGVHFALYRQVTDTLGNKRKDYLPMSGYEDLVTFTDSETHESGIIPKITTDLAAGTYYLTETAVPEGSDYKLPDKDLCFTIGRDGNITIENEGHAGWLSIVDNGNGKVKNTITIPNSKKEIVPTGIPAHRMMHFIILLLAVTAAAWVFARYRNSSISRPYRS